MDPIYFLITCNNTLSVNDSSAHIIPKKNVVCLCNSSSKINDLAFLPTSFGPCELDNVNQKPNAYLVIVLVNSDLV